MDGVQKIRKRNRIIDAVVFSVILAAVSSVTLVLFYRQVYGNPDLYHSDMKAYILEMQGLDSGYSFPYPVFFKFAALIHLFTAPEPAVAIATMLLNSLGLLVTKLALNHLTLPILEGRLGEYSDSTGVKFQAGAGSRDLTWLAGIIVSLASAFLFFLSMLYPPAGIYLPGIKFKYMGVFSPNPFHNATYLAARPFAVLAFLWYGKLLPVYENGLPGWRKDGDRGIEKAVDRPSFADYVLFSMFLLLATMTKPSFTLVMVSTAGLLMLYRLFRAKFRNFIPTLQLGLCFIPTFLDLLYQYGGVFVPAEGEEGGLGLCFGEVWAQYCENIPLAVCLAVGFPLSVLLLNLKECKKNTLFRFSFLLYLVSFLEAFLLCEKGFRKYHFNFSWGYMCGIFFFHFGALALLLQVTVEKMAQRGSAEGRKRNNRFNMSGCILILQWLAYLCHVVCGLFYFVEIFNGATYY